MTTTTPLSSPPSGVASPVAASSSSPSASSSSPPILHIENLSKSIDNRTILQHINLTITQPTSIALLGPNGAGKSTLLHILALLSPHTSGSLSLFGQKITPRSAPALRSRIGLIGHQPMLYADLSAFENLLFFARLYRLPNPKSLASQMLETVRLSHRANSPVSSFSRGMTQRLSIARALLHNPPLLLADEPFSGLDLPSILDLENLLASLQTQGKTIILSNHDIPQSLRITQRTLVLSNSTIALDQPSHPNLIHPITQLLTTPTTPPSSPPTHNPHAHP